MALLFALLFAVATRAQSVRWEAGESGIASQVQLVFENCAPDGQPDLPPLPGATLTFQGQSESVNIVNFQMTRTVTLSYLVRSRQNTPVQIPAFTVKTSKGLIRVPAFNAAAPAATLESIASSKLTPGRTSVWVGEVFALNYELSASRRTNPQISPTFDWNAAPLVTEEWSKFEVTEGIVGGERRVQVAYRTRAIAKTPNTLKLEAASHLLQIQTGTVGFGIISQPRMESVSVTSNQPVLEIRPLPAPPAGFSGAVGQFKLVSKVVPEKAALGEPITWTVELSGTGNWPDIAGLPAREVSSDFQVVQPKAKRTPAEGKLFDVTLAEDVVLVPTKAGSYTLGPIAFTYFDPKSGSYKTISAPRTTATITAPAAPLFNTVPQPATTPLAPEPAARTATPLATPPAPAGIPRDPLPGSAQVMAPLARGALTLWLVAPFAGLLILWFGLAVRRAQKTDPVRPRREARARLAATLAQLETATDASRPALLLAWQRDTALLWQISHAAPSAAAFNEGALTSPRSSAAWGEGAPPDSGSSTWAALWAETDRALYGPTSLLPSDWVARAQAALAAKRVPGFRLRRLFLPQNLMPFAAALAFLPVAAPALLRAAGVDPAAAYRQGDFAAAEQAWRATLATTPTDWIARHNLSLALAQQDRTGEAAAQAAAAFVQQPADPSVRWHFVLASEKAGFAPGALSAFVTPGPLQSLARRASPAVWQVAIIVAAFAGTAALGAMLFNGYGRRNRAVYWRAAIALALSLLVGATATAGVLTYGMAANAQAVAVTRAGILRSIPTEADTTQKTSALAAGTLALADRTFLGWTHLAFDNGQTGWVRKDAIVPLWK
ncbi:MAG: BatD family protein [Verrucomicrobia bacterium]|nr:BatD family protein [Verrucomicrobiota bacterium]